MGRAIGYGLQIVLKSSRSWPRNPQTTIIITFQAQVDVSTCDIVLGQIVRYNDVFVIFKYVFGDGLKNLVNNIFRWFKYNLIHKRSFTRKSFVLIVFGLNFFN